MNIQRRARIMSSMVPGMMMVLAAMAVSPTASRAQEARPPAEVIYHTKITDTLIDLARRYFNRVEDYRIVQQLNHVPVPEHLKPGIDLRIPVALLRGDPVTATVVTFRGDVRMGEDRRAVTPGAILAEGTRIETGPASFLTLRAADGSIVTIPSQSVLRLERMRRLIFTNTLDQQFVVERGRLETTVAKQVGPGSRYEIRTPIAVSAVRGTVFRVAYDGLGGSTASSITEVLGGTVAVGAPGARQAMPVPLGMGAAVARDGGVRTETLLPPPALADANRMQAGRTLRFAMAPVPGAVSYHMQIASDAAFQDIRAETRSTGPEGKFDALPDGPWFLRATAISASGFEGLPATQPFERRPHALDATLTWVKPGEYRARWDYAGDPDVHFRFQMLPTGRHRPIALDEDGLHASTLLLDDVPPGPYRWRVGAINGKNGEDMWTPWRDVIIGRALVEQPATQRSGK